MKNELMWNKILDVLSNHINKHSFKTWFSTTKFLYREDNTLYIKVGTKFASNYLNTNYTKLLSEIAEGLYQEKLSFVFTFKAIEDKEEQYKKDDSGKKQQYPTGLRNNYNFDAFVIGKNNKFAHSASMAVAESLGQIYNPLFIYGESGMGKTHLMQAIGNYTLEHYKSKSVYYTTTEQFTNDMIDSLRANKMPQFRNKYRNIDLLLIDDIHFLAKKEGTQEEFFHTFNALYENKKQIVMTSDRPPKDIADLEKRLVTRFEWGLLADLKTPDFETRFAILKKKAAQESVQLNDDVLSYIAENITNNVRALEGSLIRILAYSSYNSLSSQDITPQIASEVLTDMIPDDKNEITLELITTKVCDSYGITKKDILSKSRRHNITFPRHIAMYLGNLLIPNLALKEVANHFKRKDHTTVIHAKKKIEKKFKNDNEFRIQIEHLIKDIKNKY